MDSARGGSTVPWAVRRVAHGAARRDAAALNATLAAQGGCGCGCGGDEDRLGSSPYSAREEQERARRMRGCIS